MIRLLKFCILCKHKKSGHPLPPPQVNSEKELLEVRKPYQVERAASILVTYVGGLS